MRTTLIAAGTIAVLTLTAACQVPDDGKSSAAAPPAASSSGPASPTAKAKLTGTCDYDLGDSATAADYTISAEV
jgi:hypothetical protein